MAYIPVASVISVVILASVVLFILALFLRFVPVGLWITAYFSGVKVSIGTLIGMRLRRVNPSHIIQPLIKATKAGLILSTN